MFQSPIPLFPLPDVVLFPHVFLPLHVFEPRYRQMVADALAGDRLIGMVLLKPGWVEDYEGRPPVFPVGCAGLISHVEPLADGCYDIVLHGLERFRIERELEDREYRRAYTTPWPDVAAGTRQADLAGARQRLEALVLPAAAEAGSEVHLPASMSDVEVVNALAQYLDLEAIERQALLEQADPLSRCGALVELLEMKALTRRLGPSSPGRH